MRAGGSFSSERRVSAILRDSRGCDQSVSDSLGIVDDPRGKSTARKSLTFACGLAPQGSSEG